MKYLVQKKFKLILLLIDIIGNILFFIPNFILRKKNKIYLEHPKNIVVIRLDHIGDMVLTTSFFKNLKKNYPESKITVICRELTIPILKRCEYIDEMIPINTLWGNRGEKIEWKKLFRILKENYKKYDLGFELHTSPFNIILLRILSKNSIGYKYRGLGFLLTKGFWNNEKKIHITEKNLNLLENIGGKIFDRSLELKISKSKIIKDKQDEKWIGLQIISGRENKNWELDKWNKLILKILKSSKNVKIYLLGSKLDKEKIENLVINERVINVAGNFKLDEIIDFINELDLLISVDTMAVHIANALNKKLIALYGPTNGNIWGPFHKNSVIIQGKYNNCYGLELSKCKYKETNSCGKCMDNITVEEVYKKVEELI
ncbi:glycosyltransferase family 9 protein [Haliovirga abyssi]|uniref:Glycosyltransferase family 9 protein n=1 Tax=Haliovirga abyssi TaxID=2996794 RepID=A0AAU9DFD2_9FUSO|nr:glycosyltransferase family 9 protein [Haliovirga abyssi]BDU51122.1 hypothetical protein HLVA_16910 [Haliovirga abyssi]